MKQNMKKWLGVSIFVLGLYVCSATHAQATEYYVDKTSKGGTCSDSNAGTITQPWCTIQKSANTLVAGDTVFVREGTYNEKVNVKNSGSSGKPIIFKNYSGEYPIIDGTGISLTASYEGLFNSRGKSYITVDGFEVRNATSFLIRLSTGNNLTIKNCIAHDNDNADGSDNNQSGIMIDHCNGGLIENNESYHTGHNAITTESTNNVVIQYNYVHDNPNHAGINIFPKTSETQIEYSGNDIKYNIIASSANGIYMRFQKDNEITGNLIYDNNIPGKNGAGISIFDHPDDAHTFQSNTKIQNNTIANNLRYGIQNINANNVTIKNNVFYNAGASYTIYTKTTSGHSFNNNLYYGNTKIYWGGTAYASPSALKTATGQEASALSANPLFVDVSKNNFHLQKTSPAINAGANVGLAKDLDDVSIPQGSAPDIGVYEYKESPPPPPACQLTSASWSQLQATEGDVVQLNTLGTNCEGKTFNFTIKEDDGLLTDDVITSFTSSSLVPNWTTVYTTDQLGGPEYYFEVYEVGNTANTLTSSKTAELIVAKKPAPPIDLIASYDFNETTGTILTDSMASHNGAIIGATRVVGYEGNALSFNGNGQQVDIPYSSSLTPQNISVAFWMKTAENTATSTEWNSVIGGAGGDGYNNGWRFIDYQNKLRLQLNFGTLPPVSLASSSATLPINTWVHVAFTYDGNVIKLYQDGIETATATNSALLNWLSSGDMHLGYAQSGRNFNGALDNFKIYGRALTAEEIRELSIVKCVLKSGAWSQTQAIEGDIVQLNVQAENCEGKTFNYTIREDDGLFPDDVMISFVSTELNPNWVTVNLGDQLGDPEYYFEVYEVGNPTNGLTSDKTAELIVAKNTCLDVDGDSYDTCSAGESRDDGKIKDCNDADTGVNPGVVEICGDGIDNNCDGKDDSCPDTLAPTIISFEASLVTESSEVNASWNATDNIGLTRTELWRTTDNGGGTPNETSWGQVFTENITEPSITGNFVDTPLEGTWWYKIKAIDQSNNHSEKISSKSIKIVSSSCLPETLSYACEKENPITLCSGGLSKVTQKAICYEIKMDSCGNINRTPVANNKCGRTCQDKVLNCGSNKWKEVAP